RRAHRPSARRLDPLLAPAGPGGFDLHEALEVALAVGLPRMGAREGAEVGLAVREPARLDVGGEELLERLRAAGGTAADGLLEDVDGPVGHAGRLVHLAEVAKPHLDHELVVAREDAEAVEAEEPRAGDDRGRGGDARPAPAADPGD